MKLRCNFSRTFIIFLYGISLLVTSLLWGQTEYSFNQIFQNKQRGTVQNTAITPDGSIITANGNNGISIFDYNDHELSLRETISIDGFVSNVAVMNDSIFFIAVEFDGIYTCRYNGSELSTISRIGVSGIINDIAIGSDGIIFISFGHNGLSAYFFDGTDIILKDNVKDEGYANKIFISDEGRIFLADGPEGLKCYRFIGDKLILESGSSTQGSAQGVFVVDDSRVYIANGANGLSLYNYNSSTKIYSRIAFKNENSYATDVVVDGNYNIFVSYGKDGIRTYLLSTSSYSTSFARTKHVTTGGYAGDIVISDDNEVFYANGYDGLRTCRYEGNAFVSGSRSHNAGYAHATAINDNGVVFCANGDAGLYAYNIEDPNRNYLAFTDPGGSVNDVVISSNGTIFVACGKRGLRAYKLEGTTFRLEGYFDDDGEAVALALDNTQKIYLSDATYGLRVFSYKNGTFTALSKKSNWASFDVAIIQGIIYSITQSGVPVINTLTDSSISGIVIASSSLNAYDLDGVLNDVILAEGFNGMSSYHSNADTYMALRTAHLDNLCITSVARAKDSTVFAFSAFDGLYAFNRSNKSFNELAYKKTDPAFDSDITRDDLGGIILSKGEYGFSAYSYNGSAQFQTKTVELRQNYPNPFNIMTEISFYLYFDNDVNIGIYDLRGNRIRSWNIPNQSQGNHRVMWNGQDDHGNICASGIYLFTLNIGNYSTTKRMVLIK